MSPFIDSTPLGIPKKPFEGFIIKLPFPPGLSDFEITESGP